MSDDRLIQLIDDYLCGHASPRQMAELEQAIQGGMETRELFWDRVRWHERIRKFCERQHPARVAGKLAGASDELALPIAQAIELPAASTAADCKFAGVADSRPLVGAVTPVDEIPSGNSSPVKSPVLGFLGGAIDYFNHSRMLMFWLMALLVSGWFAFQLGSLMMGRAHPGGAPVAGQPADPNSPDVPHSPGVPFAPPAFGRQGGPVAPGTIALVTALLDCHWRVVPPAVPTALAPAPAVVDARAGNHLASREPFEVGSELSAGQQLDLIHGLAAITFRSGARVVLNGPAHFTVGSPLGGTLQVGKLTARVPRDAHGFTVNTPAGKVVDLGTEFGVAVAADHTMDVEVFVGQVTVDSAAVDASATDGQTPGLPSATPTKPSKLSAGHAAHVEAGKPVAAIPLDPKRFVRGLGPREDSHVAQAAYLDFLRSLKPVVWFRMEGQNKDRVLHDEMGGPDAKLFWDGPGNPFVEGHVGKGLWLRGPELGDYALVPDYPKADKGRLSVVAWVYADSHPAWAGIAKNWGNGGRGQFEFTLMGNGGDLGLYLAQADGKQIILSEGGDHPLPLNEWQHVAFTTDGTTVRLYRQGREVASATHNGLHYPVLQKSLGIGVKIGDDEHTPFAGDPSYWSGKIDELALFNETLTAEQIRKLATAAPPQ